ncbi:MAG TPA: alpha/beta hydrolase [Steroidobacteraceae bacterium]|nr:alpha/beta hydrolase [Steroidobacteraceae bacterium]
MNRPNSIRTTDGVELFYRDWGTGSPVVFLAGWALPSDFWSYQMAPLCEAGFRCIAYDRRGHGRSSDPGRNFGYDTLANDLETVLDALNLNHVQVVAHSMSAGEVVRYLGCSRVARIQRMALIGPTLPCLAKTADNPEGVDRALLDTTRREILGHGYPAWLENNARPFVTADTGVATIAWLKNMMLSCSLKAVIDCNRAMIEADFRAELKRIHVPTLVIHGDRDASAPLELTSRRIAALMPDVRLTVYEGAPHGLPITHAARLNQDLQAFLRSAPLSLPSRRFGIVVDLCDETGAAAAGQIDP